MSILVTIPEKEPYINYNPKENFQWKLVVVFPIQTHVFFEMKLKESVCETQKLLRPCAHLGNHTASPLLTNDIFPSFPFFGTKPSVSITILQTSPSHLHFFTFSLFGKIHLNIYAIKPRMKVGSPGLSYTEEKVREMKHSGSHCPLADPVGLPGG